MWMKDCRIFAMKSIYLFLVLPFVNLAMAEDPSADKDSPPHTFFNPSSRLSVSNHETRLQNLNAAFESAQEQILRQVVWHVDPNKPIDRVEVRLTEQKLYAYQNNVAVGISPVSTARDGYVTPLGSYKISDKKETYFSNQYGEFADAKGNIVDWNADLGQTPPPGAHYIPSAMPFFLRLTDEGVGLHAGYLPGYPASHGCIRLPASVAENIFHQVSVGTQVDVVR
jgi:lipoprotein-anchoring transpeptidase ErfK/SrfK